MPELARKIEIWINQLGQPSQMTIDGEEFPWHLLEEKTALEIIESEPGQLATVHVRIPARTVEIIQPDGKRESFGNDD